MKFLLLIAITYVLLVLQVSVAKDVAIGRAVPHLMLAGLVICAQRLRRLPSLGLAAGWGLLTDCLGGGLLGPQLVVCVLLAEILAVLARRPAGVRWWQAALLTIPSVFLAQVGSPWVAHLIARQSLEVAPLVAPAFSAGLYTAVLVTVVEISWRWLAGGPRDAHDAAARPVSNQWWMLTE